MNTAILKTMRAEQRPLTYIGTKAGRILGLFLVLACAAAVGSGQLITRETRQVTAANICVDGDLPGDLFCSGGVRSDVGNHSVNSISHSNNFDGTPQSPAEARTPAIPASEMAVRSGNGLARSRSASSDRR